MSLVKRLLQDPRQYLVCALFWLAMVYPMLRWWKASVLFIATMSLYTIIKGELVGATSTELGEKDLKRIHDAVGCRRDGECSFCQMEAP